MVVLSVWVVGIRSADMYIIKVCEECGCFLEGDEYAHPAMCQMPLEGGGHCDAILCDMCASGVYFPVEITKDKPRYAMVCSEHWREEWVDE